MQNLSAFADAKQQKDMLKKNTLSEHVLFSSTKAIEQMMQKDKMVRLAKITILQTDVSKIKTAIFGDHVKTIPVDAFKDAENLEKISFGKASGFGTCKPNKSSKCKVGAGAFKNCKNLREIAFFPLEYNDEEAVRAAFDDDIANEIEKRRPKCSDGISKKEKEKYIKGEYKKMKYNPSITIG